MRRECRERFPRHRGFAIPTCIMARAWCTCRDACRDRLLAVSFEVDGWENVPGIPGACATQSWKFGKKKSYFDGSKKTNLMTSGLLSHRPFCEMGCCPAYQPVFYLFNYFCRKHDTLSQLVSIYAEYIWIMDHVNNRNPTGSLFNPIMSWMSIKPFVLKNRICLSVDTITCRKRLWSKPNRPRPFSSNKKCVKYYYLCESLSWYGLSWSKHGKVIITFVNYKMKLLIYSQSWMVQPLKIGRVSNFIWRFAWMLVILHAGINSLAPGTF